MTTRFHAAHLDTLMKLKALAEKHGMEIRFGTYNNHRVEADLSLLDDYVDNELSEVLSEYYNDIVDGDIMASEERLWFELYEPRPKEKYSKYHGLTYIKKNTAFRLKDDWADALESAKKYVDTNAIEDIDKLIEFITENHGEWQGVDFYESKTLMYGFAVDGTVTDGRVYRDGMALHYFTELVCEYLKEPMIHNSY